MRAGNGDVSLGIYLTRAHHQREVSLNAYELYMDIGSKNVFSVRAKFTQKSDTKMCRRIYLALYDRCLMVYGHTPSTKGLNTCSYTLVTYTAETESDSVHETGSNAH